MIGLLFGRTWLVVGPVHEIHRGALPNKFLGHYSTLELLQSGSGAPDLDFQTWSSLKQILEHRVSHFHVQCDNVYTTYLVLGMTVFAFFMNVFMMPKWVSGSMQCKFC